MNNALLTLPTAIQHNPTTIGSSQPNPGASVLAASPIGQSNQSWQDVLNAVHGPHKGGHHGGGGGMNKIVSSTDTGEDAFGVSASSSDESVDALGTPSAKPSSTASLLASISDPFSSIASKLAMVAQLGSQKLLDI